MSTSFNSELNLHAVLQAATMALTASTTPRLDAELLLAHALNLSRVDLHRLSEKKLASSEIDLFQTLLQRRQRGEPIAYILGTQPFWQLDLKVTPDVLIPRPETELIIEIMLRTFSATQPLKIIDLGTGSGAIALALAAECPLWQIMATDVSAPALAIAQENAARYKLSNVKFCLSNWFAQVLPAEFDVIISNPPYIADDDYHLEQLQYEPETALVANNNGLAALEQIIQQAHCYLTAKGMLILEHGYQQAEAVMQLLATNHYMDIKNYSDLAGQPRVCIATRYSSETD